jgi:hypothetical protein
MTNKGNIRETHFDNTPTDIIQDSLNDLRTQVIDTTKKVGDVSNNTTIADKYSTRLLEAVSDFGDEVLSSDALYKPLPGADIVEFSYINIIRILKRYLVNLENAISDINDDVARENELVQFTRMFYELDYVSYDNQNYEDIVNIMKICVMDKTTPYSRDQIISLRVVLTEIIRSTNITEKKYLELIDKLENHFRTAGPLSNIDHSKLTHQY